MPYEFTAIGSYIHLPKQKQSTVLARLGEAISHHPLMQEQADIFLYEYRKHKGNIPLSFVAMLELWGWYPTFDQTTEDLVALTSYRTEIEDEQIERLFAEALAPDLDDGDFVEVDIDHQRRRYVCFQGKICQLDAIYVYPSLYKQKTRGKLYAGSVLAQKAVSTQFGWTQQLRSLAVSCLFPASISLEQIREELLNDVRKRHNLDGDWHLDVAFCEIPQQQIDAVSETAAH
jgi:hypothetical protein